MQSRLPKAFKNWSASSDFTLNLLIRITGLHFLSTAQTMSLFHPFHRTSLCQVNRYIEVIPNFSGDDWECAIGGSQGNSVRRQ